MIVFRRIVGLHSRLDLSMGLIGTWAGRDDTVTAVSRAYQSGNLEPGRPRLVVFDESANPQLCTVGDFRAVVEAVALHETRRGADELYRGVFVVRTPLQAAAADIYCGLWDSLRGPKPSYALARELGGGVEMLGGSPDDLDVLSEMLAMLRLRAA